MDRFKPTLTDVFYALTLQEIAAQPGLREELGDNHLDDVARRAFRYELHELSYLGDEVWGLGAQGVIAQLAPPPEDSLRELSRIRAAGADGYYAALCRSALVHLFWGEPLRAESRLAMAIRHNGDGAFAHHALGLLKGYQGDRDGARHELQEALNRETFYDPRERIGRALAALR
ncbi:MAG: hypothetical protein CMH57_06675 [Myxococcales bacterium]|nr:hypothetical protein [Myxococcales bacterium]